MLIMSPVTSATSDTAPPPSHSEAVRYGWPLPRRRGAYLTGTVGPDRLGGLDAARGLALLGMMAAHVGFTTCGLTSLSGVLNQAHGRSAVLFAVIAGFSLGIMSGRTRPHTGEDLVRTRLRILVRCALLLVLGTCLAVLGSSWATTPPGWPWPCPSSGGAPGACSSWRPSPRQSAL